MGDTFDLMITLIYVGDSLNIENNFDIGDSFDILDNSVVNLI